MVVLDEKNLPCNNDCAAHSVTPKGLLPNPSGLVQKIFFSQTYSLSTVKHTEPQRPQYDKAREHDF